MSNYVFYGKADAGLSCRNTDYELARQGSGTISVQDPATLEFKLGREYDGTNFDVHQAFVEFDTSRLSDDADWSLFQFGLALKLTSAEGSAVNTEVRVYDWGGVPIDPRMFVPVVDLPNYPLVATSAQGLATRQIFPNVGDSSQYVNRRGITRFLLISARQYDATAPVDATQVNKYNS